MNLEQIEALERLVALRDAGALTEDEFDQQRDLILGMGIAPKTRPPPRQGPLLSSSDSAQVANAADLERLQSSGPIQEPPNRSGTFGVVFLLVLVVAGIAWAGWAVFGIGRASSEPAASETTTTIEARHRRDGAGVYEVPDFTGLSIYDAKNLADGLGLDWEYDLHSTSGANPLDAFSRENFEVTHQSVPAGTLYVWEEQAILFQGALQPPQYPDATHLPRPADSDVGEMLELDGKSVYCTGTIFDDSEVDNCYWTRLPKTAEAARQLVMTEPDYLCDDRWCRPAGDSAASPTTSKPSTTTVPLDALGAYFASVGIADTAAERSEAEELGQLIEMSVTELWDEFVPNCDITPALFSDIIFDLPELVETTLTRDEFRVFAFASAEVYGGLNWRRFSAKCG